MQSSSHAQVTAAAVHPYCSVFVMRRANSSVGLGGCVRNGGGREGNEGEKGSKKEEDISKILHQTGRVFSRAGIMRV